MKTIPNVFSIGDCFLYFVEIVMLVIALIKKLAPVFVPNHPTLRPPASKLLPTILSRVPTGMSGQSAVVIST